MTFPAGEKMVQGLPQGIFSDLMEETLLGGEQRCRLTAMRYKNLCCSWVGPQHCFFFFLCEG